MINPIPNPMTTLILDKSYHESVTYLHNADFYFSTAIFTP